MSQFLFSRADARDRALLGTLISGAGLQLATVASALLSLPFVTRELSAAEFGVLATLTGFLALFAFSDLGISSALTTRLAQLRGKDDASGARVAVSTAVVASVVAVGVVGVLLAACVWLLPWQSILGAQNLSSATVLPAVASMAAATTVSAPAVIGQRVLYGLQRGSVANAWLLGAAILSAICSIGAALADMPLFVFVLTALGVPVLVGIACTAWTLTRGAPDLRPRWHLASRAEWRSMRNDSVWYFLIAVAAAVGFQTDALIVASVLGAASAGVYGVGTRVFGLISQSIYPVLLQLWPAFGEAYARGDGRWIRSRLAWSTGLAAAGSGFAGLVLVGLGEDLVRTWLTEELAPSRALLVAFAIWTTYSLTSAPLFLLLNAVGRARFHACVAVAVALANVPLSVWFTREFGTSGPLWGSLVASVLLSGVPGLWVGINVLRTLGSAEGHELTGVPAAPDAANAPRHPPRDGPTT